MRSGCELKVTDPESGLEGFLVVAKSERALSFGGLRVDPAVTAEQVAQLAETMDLKLAGHGSPVGGAKAGIRAEPDDPRLRAFLGRFAQGCREVLTTTTVLGKDMGARQWMLDEVYAALGIEQLALATGSGGKGGSPPARLRDLAGYRRHMTGLGAFWSLEQALGGDARGARVLIQGFGVVGAGVAWHLQRAGARIVGLSDREQAVLHPLGIELEPLLTAQRDDGRLPVAALPASCLPAARDELLEQSAEVLVLAAASNLIDRGVAARLRVPLVVEAANLAIAPAARQDLHSAGIRVVPDVVASSASAALVGHQIAAANRLDPRHLWPRIEADIRRSTDGVERVSKQMDSEPKAAFRRFLDEAAGGGFGRGGLPATVAQASP